MPAHRLFLRACDSLTCSGGMSALVSMSSFPWPLSTLTSPPSNASIMRMMPALVEMIISLPSGENFMPVHAARARACGVGGVGRGRARGAWKGVRGV